MYLVAGRFLGNEGVNTAIPEGGPGDTARLTCLTDGFYQLSFSRETDDDAQLGLISGALSSRWLLWARDNGFDVEVCMQWRAEAFCKVVFALVM